MPVRPLASRALDVVVFGATGDTGSAACRILYHHAAALKVRSWAPAARNLEKLKSQVLDPLESNSHRDGVLQWRAPMQADSDDLVSLRRMCERARVVVACAGPYERYGEKVMAACVLSGTHYVDVTGEVDWVNAMRKRYNDAARASGVSIVSFCGYDSVPMDVTAWLLASALRDKAGDEAQVVETFASTEAKGGGGTPTGTINTVLQTVNRLRYRFSLGLLGEAPPDRKAVSAVHNELPIGGDPLLSDTVKRRVARDMKRNNGTFESELEPGVKVKSGPHFMARVNMPVVQSTAAAEGFDFEYHERMVSGGRGAWEKARAKAEGREVGADGDGKEGGASEGLLTGTLARIPRPLLMLAAAPLVMSPFFESAVWWFVKRSNAQGKEDSGEDDTGANLVQQLMNRGEQTGYVGVKGFARGKNGAVAVSSFESDYEAGIGFTMLSALAVAGALRQKQATTGANGFQTPVMAVGGDMLRAALADAGVRINVRVVDGVKENKEMDLGAGVKGPKEETMMRAKL